MDWLRYQVIRVYSEPIDFRKQMNGLIDVVLGTRYQPNDGSLYVFRNRQGNKVKLLIWDRNGYYVGYKRLAKGRFDFPLAKDGTIVLTKDELFALISGMPMLYHHAENKPIFHH